MRTVPVAGVTIGRRDLIVGGQRYVLYYRRFTTDAISMSKRKGIQERLESLVEEAHT